MGDPLAVGGWSVTKICKNENSKMIERIDITWIRSLSALIPNDTASKARIASWCPVILHSYNHHLDHLGVLRVQLSA